ncbi:two-component sensor histidine kinase [Pilimelia terevasa]|uniref:histidine kinase n=1 Tax=Pilimelia terevasa TaxID=53372 RepID=A0A8J3BKJ7_9ACTN|nr:HAMP domain-containing sensor histidine kinase [Pilimelia terevasa]GGK29015.1 two-component sensor histidine kinase [Pilimelia terevasa]
MTRRLLLSFLTFAVLVLTGLAVPLGLVYQRSERQHAFGQLEHDAEVFAAFVDAALNDRRAAQVDLLAQESAGRLGGHVDVVDARGEVTTCTHPRKHPPGSLAAAADIRTVLSGHGRISTRTAESDGVALMSVAVPIHPGVAARGAVRVSVPTAPLTSRIEQFWLLLAGVGVAVLAAVAGIAFALARWISRPVRALERATRHWGDGTLPPPTTTGPPELRRLATTFHAAANRVQALLESQRSFVGHASHQLKTPLAALRLRLENLEPDVGTDGGRNLQAAIAETDRLAHLVEMLLRVARSEHGSLPRGPVVLADAVADRLFVWSPLAAERDVRLSASGAPDTQVVAVTGAVDQILDNLLSNALRAAPPGSSVRIAWQPDGGGMVALHVVDAGPGLPEEQRRQALEPFWRAPDAGKGGTGLGLALVRRLAEVGGGAAALHAAAGSGGVDAVVTFPADEPVAA